jgi:antibiotic biosynthesis monooxygenase (ABM) superfamily enzyme
MVPNLSSLPYPVTSAVAAAVIVLCLTWVVMPALVQLCRSWLH